MTEPRSGRAGATISAILLVPPLPHVLHPKAVSDPHPARASLEKEDKRTFLQKIAEFIHPGPDSKAELIETLADAEDNDIIGAESRVMLEGVIRMAELTAGDVMVAAPRMDLLNIDSPHDDILGLVIDTAHSRFPVYEGDRENIIGILHGQGPAEAAAGARAEHPCLAAPGGLRAGDQGPERPAARVPRQPQPPGDRRRRVRPDRGPDHHRGRARADRRRDRGRVRHRRGRGRHLRPGRPHLSGQRRHRRSSASAKPSG